MKNGTCYTTISNAPHCKWMVLGPPLPLPLAPSTRTPHFGSLALITFTGQGEIQRFTGLLMDPSRKSSSTRVIYHVLRLISSLYKGIVKNPQGGREISNLWPNSPSLTAWVVHSPDNPN